jgi:hypothetical protein
LLVIDALVLYGLHLLDRRIKLEKSKLATEKDMNKEILKKESNASKAAVRQQQHQILNKQIHNQGKAYPSTVPKFHILQPDKMK